MKNRSKRAFSSCSPHGLPTLISQICSQKGLKLPVLKTLYYLLTRLSLNASVNSSNCEVSYNCLDKDYYQCGLTVKFSEICGLSDVLFERLDNRFNQLFYAFRDHVSTSQSRELPVLGSNLSESIEELTLLLRCCMVILTLLVSDQNQLIQKGQVLLLILSRLISTDLSSRSEETSVILRKLVPCEFEHVEDGCTAPALEGFVASLCLIGSSNPLHTILSSLLEVFADELLMQKLLREYFVLIDSASSISEMLFMCHFGHDDIGTVLEVIAAHFILSVSNEQAFEGFLNRLFWQHDNNFRIPEMSLTASLSLLLNPIILSAPNMLQAYLILLVSEAIGIGMSSNYLKPDPGNMDWYLTAFERSLILYARHMSNFHTNGHPIGINNSTVKPCILGSNQLTCESFLQPATRKKINHLATKFNNDSWDSYVNNRSARKKSDLVDASITYAKESLYLFDEQCGDKILSMLTSILRGSADDIRSTVLYIEGRSCQEIYLLASILKLMSSSMLQAIWCLRRSSSSGYLKTLQDVLLREKYDFLVHLIGGFRQFNIYQPIQRFVSDMMKTYPTRHKESKWMLLHLLGLLSSSFVSGLDFLVKNCTFTMMSLLNFFFSEEGDLDALSSLINSWLESMSSKSSDKIRKVLTEQRSSKRIASKFQKVQKLCLSKRSLTSFRRRNNDKQIGTSENASILNHMDSPICMEVTAEVCNGEIFLKCLQDSFNTSFDIDDLADFIECKPGKDYSVWLKDRQRFRKWQLKRKVVNKCQTQKKKWKYKGK